MPVLITDTILALIVVNPEQPENAICPKYETLGKSIEVNLMHPMNALLPTDEQFGRYIVSKFLQL